MKVSKVSEKRIADGRKNDKKKKKKKEKTNDEMARLVNSSVSKRNIGQLGESVIMWFLIVCVSF
jgi:hypothetical protein